MLERELLDGMSGLDGIYVPMAAFMLSKCMRPITWFSMHCCALNRRQGVLD